MELTTQTNERRCAATHETHILSVPPCCPISSNPRPGSTVEISYRPEVVVLEVKSLRAYIDDYQGGRGDVRSMESMIQQIAQDCANAVGVPVNVDATLLLEPRQKMKLCCVARPAAPSPHHPGPLLCGRGGKMIAPAETGTICCHCRNEIKGMAIQLPDDRLSCGHCYLGRAEIRHAKSERVKLASPLCGSSEPVHVIVYERRYVTYPECLKLLTPPQPKL